MGTGMKTQLKFNKIEFLIFENKISIMVFNHIYVLDILYFTPHVFISWSYLLFHHCSLCILVNLHCIDVDLSDSLLPGRCSFWECGDVQHSDNWTFGTASTLILKPEAIVRRFESHRSFHRSGSLPVFLL